jgi:hypothetical protein
MRINLLPILCIVLLLPVKSIALEPVNEAHAMIYYQVPFSANKSEQKKHSFGFRMDHTSYNPGEMIQYSKMVKKTAAFDFKMGHEGVQGMYVSGVDYLQLYRLRKAAEDEGGEEVVDADSESKSNPVTEVAGNIGETIDEIMDIVPLGFLIGGAIGVVLMTGAGG